MVQQKARKLESQKMELFLFLTSAGDLIGVSSCLDVYRRGGKK